MTKNELCEPSSSQQANTLVREMRPDIDSGEERENDGKSQALSIARSGIRR